MKTLEKRNPGYLYHRAWVDTVKSGQKKARKKDYVPLDERDPKDWKDKVEVLK